MNNECMQHFHVSSVYDYYRYENTIHGYLIKFWLRGRGPWYLIIIHLIEDLISSPVYRQSIDLSRFIYSREFIEKFSLLAKFLHRIFVLLQSRTNILRLLIISKWVKRIVCKVKYLTLIRKKCVFPRNKFHLFAKWTIKHTIYFYNLLYIYIYK